jgi:hypothetical protein
VSPRAGARQPRQLAGTAARAARLSFAAGGMSERRTVTSA